jgi:hypothetical protein
MEYELKVIDKEIDAGAANEPQKSTSKGPTERDLSLRAVPAVNIAIRDVNISLRGSHANKAPLSLRRRKRATGAGEETSNTTSEKKILNTISADFPSGTLTGKALACPYHINAN